MPLKIDIKEDYLYNHGIAEGREEGARDALIDLYSRGILSLSMVAEQLGSTEEEVLDFVEKWKSKPK